jgi:hypothetical protein
MRGRKLSKQFDQNSAYNNIKTSIVSLCDAEKQQQRDNFTIQQKKQRQVEETRKNQTKLERPTDQI